MATTKKAGRPMTVRQEARRERLEALVDEGLQTFDRISAVLEPIGERDWSTYLAVGAALEEIHSDQLYHPETWEDYCLQRWTYTRWTIERRMKLYRFIRVVLPVLVQRCTLPDSDRRWSPGPGHAQALEELLEEQQRAVLEQALNESPTPTIAELEALAEAAKADAEEEQVKKDTGPKKPSPKKGGQVERVMRDQFEQDLAGLTRPVVRMEALLKRGPHFSDEQRALVSSGLKALRRVFTKAFGNWPWRDKKPGRMHADGRTPEDRKSERARDKARHPNRDAKERERKAAERERKRVEKKKEAGKYGRTGTYHSQRGGVHEGDEHFS
jgi:hypothetical protein